MTTSSSDHLRCLLLFAPKLLKSSHTLTAFPYLPLDLPSTYCYLPLPHCCTKTALAKVSEAHVSFNLLNTSWYLSRLILGCLKCHWQLRTISHFGFRGLAASSPSFHQSMAPPRPPSQSPPSLLIPGICKSFRALLSSPSLHIPLRGFIITWASVTFCTLLFLKGTSVCFCFSIFCPAPATFLVTASVFPVRTFPCPYSQSVWFDGTTGVVMWPGPSFSSPHSRNCFRNGHMANWFRTFVLTIEGTEVPFDMGPEPEKV